MNKVLNWTGTAVKRLVVNCYCSKKSCSRWSWNEVTDYLNYKRSQTFAKEQIAILPVRQRPVR